MKILYLETPVLTLSPNWLKHTDVVELTHIFNKSALELYLLNMYIN